jgi:hypothetical protein
MRILSSENTIEDTDVLSKTVHYSVLSFRDYKNPDFYMEKLRCVDEVESASISIEIGPFKLVMPFSWSIVITDFDILECIPLSDVIGKSFPVFCMNPIDGYLASFHSIRTGMFFAKTTWTAPPMGEKDMLVIPLGFEARRERLNREGVHVEVGPICAIFSPTKMEINKQIADIW